jgi:hypothetical protein
MLLVQLALEPITVKKNNWLLVYWMFYALAHVSIILFLFWLYNVVVYIVTTTE